MIEMTLEGADTLIADLANVPTATTRGLLRALNRGISAAQTVMTREIGRDMGLKAGDVRDRLRLRNATLGTLEAMLGASLKQIPLIKFDARGSEPSRGKGRGVSYKIGQGGRSRFEQAFIATMGGQHRGVFVRKASLARRSAGAWSKNLPIKELFGPSVGHVFGKYRSLGLKRAEDAFMTTFAHEEIFRAAANAGTH